MRNSLAIVAMLLSGVLLAGVASAVDPVYKWSDSSGRSHYSQTPPEGQKYQTITPSGTTSSPVAPLPATNAGEPMTAPSANGPTQAQVERQKYCETARNNVQTLTTKPMVDMDLNGDGKPERLTAAQQTEQLAKAQQQVQLLCAK